MYLIRRQTIVPDIVYTITKMEFGSINIRMTFTNTKVVTPSSTIILYIKHSTVTILIYVLNLSATPTGPFRQSSIRRYFCGRGRALLRTESTFRRCIDYVDIAG